MPDVQTFAADAEAPEMAWLRGVAVAEGGCVRFVHATGAYDPFQANRERGSDPPLYLQFADLAQADDELLARFAGSYGPLGLAIHGQVDPAFAPGPQGLPIDEPAEDVRAEARAMRAVVELWRAWAAREDDPDGLREPFRRAYLSLYGPNAWRPEFDALQSSRLVTWAEIVLSRAINRQREAGACELKLHFLDHAPQDVWTASTLLGALYVMLALDLSGLPPQTCGNSRCGRLFKPERVGQLYCSVSCRRAQLVRDYRERERSKREGASADGQES